MQFETIGSLQFSRSRSAQEDYMEGEDNITGADQLIAVFGYWPSFHDAEILWLRLDRQSRCEGCNGPTLDALVHAFEMTSEVDGDGYYVLRHNVLVHLRFSKVVELQIEGFNHQNALMGLALSDVSGRQLERVKWEVRFDSAHGVDASFQCYSLEVVSVVPCDKSGNPV